MASGVNEMTDLTAGSRRRTAVTARIGPGVGALWGALPTAGRIALAGVLASAALAVVLGIFIPVEIRRHLLVAEGRGLQAAVIALEPSLPTLTDGPLSGQELIETHRLVDRALLDSDHVRAKLWSLDGIVLYSDEAQLIGRTFAEMQSGFDEVLTGGVRVAETDLGHPENVMERTHGRLIEFYIPVRGPDGNVVAVFEIYEDVALLEEALSRITFATRLAIGSGLAVLLLFVMLLLGAALRSINRDRAAAEARADELGVMVSAAEALASTLEPAEFLARLADRIEQALDLSRIGIEPEPPDRPGVFQHQLRDGSWLIAERAGTRIDDDDARLLRSVANSLDAALANAALYAEVRQAAQTRRHLLRRIVEAHEDERRRLVGDLHDTLAAQLIRVLYGVRGIAADTTELRDDVRRELIRLDAIVTGAEQGLRAFMGRIRPVSLDDVGLSGAIQDAVARFAQESNIGVAVRVDGDLDAFSSAARLTILRASEEGLLNVRKHAGATRVRVAVSADDRRLRLSVDDDGIGWRRDEAASAGRGLGLAYLRERVLGFGGAIVTEASRLGGARLVVEIPRTVE